MLISAVHSLALYERFVRKQKLSPLLYLKCSTSSCRYSRIRHFSKSTELLKLINNCLHSHYMQSSVDHGYAVIQKFNTLMNIPKRMTGKAIS